MIFVPRWIKSRRFRAAAVAARIERLKTGADGPRGETKLVVRRVFRPTHHQSPTTNHLSRFSIPDFEHTPEPVGPIAIQRGNHIAIRSKQKPDAVGGPGSTTQDAPAGERPGAAIGIGAPLPNV